MGAVAYVNAGTVQSLTTSASVPLPASLVAGNLLLLHAASADGTITSATPSGWTALPGSPFSGGGVTQARVYYKISTGSESGNISLTATGTKGHARIEQYAPAAGETLTILTQQGVTDTNSNTSLSIVSGTFSAATNDLVVAVGCAIGDFTAGAYSGFNLTATGFTVGSLGTRGSGRAGTTSYQWCLLDKPIASGTSGTTTATGTGNAASVTGVVVYVVLRSQASSLTPGFTCKVKVAGTFVTAKLRLRSAGTWITPSSITAYHPTSGTIDSRANLPWDLQQTYTGKPAATHYVPWYEISHDNGNPKALGGAGDTWDNTWRMPGSGANVAYGGVTRDRPIPRAPRGATWRALDMYDEIKRISDAKFDVIFIDYVSWSGTSTENFNNINRLFTASDAYYADTGKRVWIMPMPDGKGSATNTATANQLADTYGTWLSQAGLWYYGGGATLTIPIYNPESYSTGSDPASRITYWNAFKSRMSGTYGKTVNLWFCWVSDWTLSTTGAASSLGALAWGLSRWGDRDDVATKSTSTNNRGAPAYSHSKFGKPWMHPVSPGDNRPNDTGQSGYRWWESRGSRTLENTWRAAIDAGANCEMVQQATWNDFAEHAHLCPSENQGYSLADLNTYWLHWWKTGAAPVVQRDGLYLFHRIHPYALGSFTGSQSRFGLAWGSTPAVNEVEVLAFAKAAGTVELLVNGVVTQSAAAVVGMNRFNWALPTSGVISTRMTRSGTTVPGTVATSNVTMGGSRVADDFHHRVFSSLRQYTGT